MHKYSGLLAIAFVAGISTAPVQANTLTADGVTYSLTDQIVNSTTDQFTLTITGINGSSDTEQGRYGVQSFAFNLPSNYSIATAPAGFTLEGGGLNSNGCNGNGSFFCFFANTTPTGPALASNSSLTFTFDVALSSGSFSGYDPDFKINWDGTNNNYDLISQPLAPSVSTTPLPASWGMMLTGLALGFGFMFYQRAKREKGEAVVAGAA